MRANGSYEEPQSSGKAVVWAARQAVVWIGVAMAALVLVRHFAPAEAPSADPPAQRAAEGGPATNTIVYPAGPNGHVLLEADVDGAIVHFVVDTGATLVSLNRRDAEAAGILTAGLSYSMVMNTANGRARAAPVRLRSIRLGQLTLDDVQAVVMPNLGTSLLGMSFLSRLDRWEMRGGALTISY